MEESEKQVSVSRVPLNDGLGAWISIEERLPDQERRRVWVWPQEIAAYYFDHEIRIDGHDTYPAGWYGDHDTKPFFGVTYWQPLPEAPNVKLTGGLTAESEKTNE